MAKLASAVLAQARAWIGRNEADGTHKGIIDVYNGHKPLARGYKVKYTDAWCATFVSAVAIKCGLTGIIPTECGCGQMIALFKNLGEWQESDSRTPSPGDIIFYDWDDTGAGDCTCLLYTSHGSRGLYPGNRYGKRYGNAKAAFHRLYGPYAHNHSFLA